MICISCYTNLLGSLFCSLALLFPFVWVWCFHLFNPAFRFVTESFCSGKSTVLFPRRAYCCFLLSEVNQGCWNYLICIWLKYVHQLIMLLNLSFMSFTFTLLHYLWWTYKLWSKSIYFSFLFHCTISTNIWSFLYSMWCSFSQGRKCHYRFNCVQWKFSNVLLALFELYP